MAKARPRYIARGNIRFNDVRLEGQVVSVLGECDMRGDTKQKNGKPLLKKQKTHYKLRFDDKKWMKENKLEKGWSTFTHSKDDFEKFFRSAEEKPSAE